MKLIQRKKRSGASAVELAVVAPVLFLFVLGLVEFCRLVMVMHGLEASAREGCRMAILKHTTEDAVKEKVNERLNSLGISSNAITIAPDPLSSSKPFDPITVKVQVSYSQASILPIFGNLLNPTLAGSCTLSRESGEIIE